MPSAGLEPTIPAGERTQTNALQTARPQELVSTVNNNNNNNNYYYYYLFIYCSWVVTRWQWLFYMYTKYEIGYY